jgi:hypothetical protein
MNLGIACRVGIEDIGVLEFRKLDGRQFLCPVGVTMDGHRFRSTARLLRIHLTANVPCDVDLNCVRVATRQALAMSASMSLSPGHLPSFEVKMVLQFALARATGRAGTQWEGAPPVAGGYTQGRVYR